MSKNAQEVIDAIERAIKTIERCSYSSAQGWEMAVETDEDAGEDRGFRDDAEKCEQCYEDAIEALQDAYEGCSEVARTALEEAQRLENDAGDDSTAIRALRALDALDVSIADSNS